MEEWRFTAAVSADRVDQLRSRVSFDEVLNAILQASVGRFWWEPFDATRLKRCNRASLFLHVDPNAYDDFFNSANGYRAQYSISSGAGAAANRSPLNAPEPMLVTAAREQSRVPLAPVRGSLRGVDAKVSILETDVEEQLSDPVAARAYAPWEFDSPNGRGLLAPVGTLIEVKGAWLDPAGVETRDPARESRGVQLNEAGSPDPAMTTPAFDRPRGHVPSLARALGAARRST